MIWVIKFFVRPFAELTAGWKFMAGVAPNLIGSFLVPFVAYWLYTHPKFFNGQLLRFSFFSDTRIVCCFGLVLAVINEYLQLIPFFGRTFDYFDIASSVVGAAAGCCCFSYLRMKTLSWRT